MKPIPVAEEIRVGDYVKTTISGFVEQILNDGELLVRDPGSNQLLSITQRTGALKVLHRVTVGQKLETWEQVTEAPQKFIGMSTNERMVRHANRTTVAVDIPTLTRRPLESAELPVTVLWVETDESQPGGGLHTVKEASEMLGITRDSLYGHIKRGHVGCTRIDGRVYVPTSEIHRFQSQRDTNALAK